MNGKKITLLIALLILIGCDYRPSTKKSFDWATIDYQEIYTQLFDKFKKDDSVLLKITSEDGIKNDIEIIQHQLIYLESIEEIKCKKNREENLKKIISKNNDDNKNIPSTNDEISLFLDSSNSYINAEIRGTYQECIDKIKKEPIISDLRDKQGVLFLSNTARYKRVEEIRTMTRQFIKKAIAKFAEKNNYEVIVNTSKYTASENIIFNYDKVVLDVTTDFLQFALKNEKEIISTK